MTDAATDPAARRRKLWLQLVFGAVSGAAGMLAVLWLLDGRDMPEPDPSVIVAAGVAVVYLLIGALVGLGALFPGAGARLLNVHDREEMLEQRPMLLGSGFGCAMLGAALLALVFASTDAAPIRPQAAFWLFVAVLVITTVVSWRQWPLYDELMRVMIQESVALFGYGVSAVLVLWAAAAVSGLAAGPQPLDLLSLTFGEFLAATFVVVARRGMMELD
jgi:H+/Cl- antiporter ClcA